MADDNDEVIVNLEGDTSTTLVKATEGKSAGGGSTTSFNDDGEDPIVDLKKQFTAMSGQLRNVTAVAEEAQQRLAATDQRLQRAESQVVVSQLDTVESGIAQAQADAQAAEQAYAQAFEAGDAAAMARAQRVMARAEAHISRLAEARDTLKEEAQKTPAQRQQPHQQQPVRRMPADPVEAAVANLSPKSAAWIRAHPECITDPKMNARMMAAHNLAVAEDIPLDSEEYFQRIEEGVKVKKAAETKGGDGNGARRPSSAAAGGGSPGGGLNGGISVKLTAREAASATDGTLVWNYDDPTGQKRFKKGDPIGVAEMARRKHEGMKAGLYDKNNFEA